MIGKAYKGLLYFFGFALEPAEVPDDGEKITYMLRRQKRRLGWTWWLLVTIPSLLIAGGYTWTILHTLGVC
ncbi:hypothetical protein ACFLYS_01770 [Chloroflexota bacterium]